MKKGSFKQKTYEEVLAINLAKKQAPRAKILPAKRVSKPKKVSSKSLHTKVWKLCREIIIELYGNTCYTTYVQGLEGSNLHLSHLIAKAALPIVYKYDLRLLRPSSYHSNINLSGDTHNYLEHYLQECNLSHVDWEKFRKEIKTAPVTKTNDHLQFLIAHYTAILDQVKTFPDKREDFKNQYTRYR